jgi:hypothetical protein
MRGSEVPVDVGVEVNGSASSSGNGNGEHAHVRVSGNGREAGTEHGVENGVEDGVEPTNGVGGVEHGVGADKDTNGTNGAENGTTITTGTDADAHQPALTNTTVDSVEAFWAEIDTLVLLPDACGLAEMDSTLRMFVGFCAAYHGESAFRCAGAQVQVTSLLLWMLRS